MLPAEDQADETRVKAARASELAARDIAVYRISGAFFFGAASTVSAVMERIADQHKAFIVDLSGVPFLDSSGANAMEALARRAHKRGVILILAGGNEAVVKDTEDARRAHAGGALCNGHFPCRGNSAAASAHGQ